MGPDGEKEGEPVAIPPGGRPGERIPREAARRCRRDGRGLDGLDGQELDPADVASALKTAVTRGEVFPVACGVATKNLGTHALLDLLVEGVPSPGQEGPPIEVDGGGTAAFVFKTIADPFVFASTFSACSPET